MQKPRKIYTVSQVNSLIKAILENNLPGRLTVTGEITDFKLHHSGHCYFSLKDENALLPCVMWRSNFSKLKFRPENGMAALGIGFIDVYSPQGKYQFYVEKIEPAGIGALQLAYEQMYKHLKAEGLFEEKYKKSLPPYPTRIAIFTSESGAAIEDIKDSIWNRWPCVKLFLCPVPVQGEGAAEKIAASVRDVNRRNKTLKIDVLIVGRGGGALEDLWAFNEEVLARAIFDSKIPIISAVGHEVDTTIADLVADARASTPTKAGIVAVPDMHEVLDQLAVMQSRLAGQAKANLKLSRQNLETILASAVFRNPLLPVHNAWQLLDERMANLADAIKTLLAGATDQLNRSYEQIAKIEPHRLMGRKTLDLNNLKNRAKAAIGAVLNRDRIALSAQANRLAALNPKSVLHRGYSITTNKETGLLVRSLNDVQVEDYLITELAGQNLIESKVTDKQNRTKN
ncbi:MAG: exodeoxyribonuclease VII large subunit [Planctomycetota bacterium]|jgi:exodeoxyribonuclease VII large subunit